MGTQMMSPPDFIAEYIYLPFMPKVIRDLYKTLKYNGDTWQYNGFHLESNSGWNIWESLGPFSLSIRPPDKSLVQHTITKFKSKGRLMTPITDPGSWVIWRAVKFILDKTPVMLISTALEKGIIGLLINTVKRFTTYESP